MIRRFIHVLLFLALPFIGEAQVSAKVLQQQFVDAEYFFINEDYKNALELYQAITKEAPENYNVIYRIGLCYLRLPFETAKSIPFLEKAVTNINPKYNEGSYSETKAEPEALYYLGYAYHLCYQFEEAIQAYSKYKNQLDVKKLYYLNKVDNQIAACNVCKKMIQNPTATHFTNLDAPINSNQTDFNPCVSANDSLLIYTRVKPKTSSEEGNDEQSVIWDNRIMSCHRDASGKWTTPEDITEQLQTSGTFLTISLAPDGKTLYLFRDNYEDGGVKDNDRGALYISHWRLGSWTAARKMQLGINSLFNETHITVSANGNLLCFTSDRTEGSFGGIDIYYCDKQNDSVWSEPKNIGSAINTSFDEETPTIVNDTILVFSSEGHNTMGGFDLFYSKRIASGWSEPISLRSPINTPADELFFIPVLGGSIAYYSAERRDVGAIALGAQDIYMLDAFIEKVPVAILAEATTKHETEKKDSSSFSQLPMPIAAQTALVETPKTEIKPLTPSSNNIDAPHPSPVAETTKPAVLAAIDSSKPQINNLIAVSGIISTADNKELEAVITITIQDAYTKKVIASLTPDYIKGTYSTNLPAGNYQVIITSSHYTSSDQILYIPKNQNTNITLSTKLTPKTVSSGQYFAVKAIFFDFNSAELSREAQIELERLYVLMNENPSLLIEVVGHTDAKGSTTYNQALSLKRSQAVTKYLQSRGVEASQFAAKGVGEEAHVAINENEDGSDNPEGRRLNRHVEIKVSRSNNMDIVSEKIPVPDHLAFKKYIRFSVQVARQSTPLSADEMAKYQSASLPKLEMIQANNEFMYYTGDFRRKSDAMVLLNKIQGAGFANAEITDYFKTNRLTSIQTPSSKDKQEASGANKNNSIASNKNIENTPLLAPWYTIQLCALKSKNKRAKKNKDIKIYNCSDSLYRYTYGNYSSIDEARANLPKAIKWGFTDAFVARGSRYSDLNCECNK